jgi:hypothetical protein
MATGRVPTTANSPLTAKGDLFGYSTAPARLAVGNDGEQIVADSSTSTGLRYTAGTVQANPVINSAMQVWQRGTSFSLAASSAASFASDRWNIGATGVNQACTVSRQATGDTTNLPNIQYGLRIQRNSGQTGTGQLTFAQNIETVNSIPFAGKTVTVSYYARAGANFSAPSSALPVYLATGTGTDQNIYSGFTGSSFSITGAATLTTTWQRFTFTGTIPTTTTELAIYSAWATTGTAGANDYVDVTGFQIDIGSVALPFRTYAGTFQGELAACQRYFYLHSATAARYISMAAAYSASAAYGYLQFPVSMRTNPTMAVVSGTNYYLFYRNGTYQYINSFSQDAGYPTGSGLYATGLTQTAGNAGWFQIENAAGSVSFSAEL